MRNQRRLRAAAVFAALALAGIGACGRSDNNTSSPGGTTEGGGAVDPSSKTGPGFDGKTITVGLLTVESGLVSAIGQPMSRGFETYMKRVNEKGGIAGKFPVAIKRYDTKYTPADAVTQYNLSKGDVAMYGQILGTNVVNSLKDTLVDDEILGQPATLDAFWVHEPNLMPFGSPYQIQAINGLDYAVRKLDAKSKPACALTKEDEYGQAGLAGFEYAVGKLGLQTGTKAVFAGAADMPAVVTQLQNANCGTVVFTGLSPETNAVVTEAATRNFAPKWIGLSASWNSSLAGTPQAPSATIGYLEQNFHLAAEGVDWGDTSVEGMRQQMEDTQKYAADQAPNGYYTFGYNEAWAVHQVLEFAAKQGDLTQQGILDASHKIDKLTFGNGYADYKYGAPEERAPARLTTIFKIDRTSPNATKADEKMFVSSAAREYDIP
jgi:ABC-type branched-subunit amino acid transport system substrate-binding protein